MTTYGAVKPTIVARRVCLPGNGPEFNKDLVRFNTRRPRKGLKTPPYERGTISAPRCADWGSGAGRWGSWPMGTSRKVACTVDSETMTA